MSWLHNLKRRILKFLKKVRVFLHKFIELHGFFFTFMNFKQILFPILFLHIYTFVSFFRFAFYCAKNGINSIKNRYGKKQKSDLDKKVRLKKGKKDDFSLDPCYRKGKGERLRCFMKRPIRLRWT